MASSNLTDQEREQMRQWLATWQRAGPLLDQERAQRVRALTDTDAARMALDLWGFAQPGRGDDGEGILPMARALQKLGDR
ncbi:MAG: hypothetical protein M3541_22785 [Acidobacteriota bacterium]|jgi:hypothetical protein|nr:hypothetical protein [Acidobacteriota bacterium]MDQ3421560.1 hypothetical protein [Acidobacteriota bacterium]